MVTGNENTVLSELHKTVYATGLKLHFKLLRLNYIYVRIFCQVNFVVFSITDTRDL